MFKFSQHINGFLEIRTLNGLIDEVTVFEVEPPQRIEEIAFPEIKRLGKRAEFIFEQTLKNSKDIDLIGKNIQLIENGKTIGEIDYLLGYKKTTIHLELATKFYLWDETLDSKLVNQWIGPNRKDYLHLKLSRLKDHQFPIIKSPTFLKLGYPQPDKQCLLLKAMLFIPPNTQKPFPENFKNCIAGYWFNLEQFINLNDSEFFIPNKMDWFINPNQNKEWHGKQSILEDIKDYHSRNFSPLVWIKQADSYTRCFVVWW